MSMSSDDLLRLQSDAVELIRLVTLGARPGKDLQSIGGFDQLLQAIKDSGVNEIEAALWSRWPGNGPMLAGCAIGILVSAIDSMVGEETTDRILTYLQERVDERNDPFER